MIYENIRFIKSVIDFAVISRIRKEKSLRKYKDIHEGERCFIVCTGPSLKLEDVEMLKNEKTFAVNSCFKMFDKTKWRPTYYVITDPKFIAEMGKELKKYEEQITHAFTSNVSCWNNKSAVKINVWPKYQNLPQNGIIRWITDLLRDDFMSQDITRGIISGHTIVFSVFQIAQYMGFKEIYLLGTDCNYKEKIQYSELTPHMHYNNPNAADLMIVDYLYAKRHFEKKGIHVFNATRGGKLEVFDRINLNRIEFK